MPRALTSALALLGAACGSAPIAPEHNHARSNDAPDEPVVTLPRRAPEADGAHFELSFAASPSDDPIGLEGLTSVLVMLVTLEGQERAAAYGATLEGFRDPTRAGFRIAGPAASFESLATIVVDIALDPRLPGTELATRTERWRERLAVDPDALLATARRWAAALAIGSGRPLGLDPTDATLATLTREDLVRLHRRLVRNVRLSHSHPLSAALSERLRAVVENNGAPIPAAPRCPAAYESSFHIQSKAPGRVIAFAAPEPDSDAWHRALAPVARYPELARNARVIELGARVVLVLTGPSEIDPLPDFLSRLAPFHDAPPGLATAKRIEVVLAPGPAPKGARTLRDGGFDCGP